MKIQKIACALLAGLMAAASLSGCGGGKDGGDATAKVFEPSPTTGEKNAFGWEMPKETLKLTFFDALQGSPDERAEYDAAMHQYLLDNFNVDLEIIQYDTDPEERLNLMLSSNDYADAIYMASLTQSQKFINQGKAVELSPYIEKTTDLKARYEKYLPMLREEDGKVYRLLYQCGKGDLDKTIPCADTAPMLRQDWYEEIGSPDISTPQKYFEAVKAMVAKHPTNEAGKNTFGLSFYDTKNPSITPSFVSWWGGLYGLRQGWDWGADGKTLTTWVNSEKGEKLIKYMNQFSREGLLDPDGFVMTVEQWGEKGIDERYAAYVGPWFQPGFYISDHWLKLKGDAYPPLMRYVHYDVKDEGIEQSTFNPQNGLGSYFVFLTDKCSNPADYMRWFEFEQSTLGVKLMGYGIPNEADSIWTIDMATGEYAFVPEKVAQITADVPIFDFDPYMKLGGDCQMVITGTTEILEDGTNCWFNQTNKDKWKKLKDENLKNSFYNSTAFAAIVMDPKNPLIDTKQRCTDIIMSGYANAILAPTEEECTALFNKMRDEANAAGLQEVEKFYSDEFNKNLEKWSK